MKISICIPQFNRISYLLHSLKRLERQTYQDIEVVISDDCSDDDTFEQISLLKRGYKYPIIYSRNETNLGYDRNYRKSLELASGTYALVLGNDDSLNEDDSIDFLVSFLKSESCPDIGFCNMVEGEEQGSVVRRAHNDRILGSGAGVAMKYYSCFSFVGGLIYRLDTFRKFNSGKCDGSIYSQIYLGVLIIAGGGRLFCIEKPMVIKDILIGDEPRGSYRDRLARKWRDYKIVDGGLPSVMHVLITAFNDAGASSRKLVYRIFRRVYIFTLPYWLMDFRENDAFPEAFGLFRGLNPFRNRDFLLLSVTDRIKILFFYLSMGIASLLTPVVFLRFLYKNIYGLLKK